MPFLLISLVLAAVLVALFVYNIRVSGRDEYARSRQRLIVLGAGTFVLALLLISLLLTYFTWSG